MDNRVAFVGKTKSGKTIAARHFQDLGYYGMSFAGEAKLDVQDMLNNQIVLSHKSHVKYPITQTMMERDKVIFREFVKWYAHDFTRVYLERPNHWIDTLTAKINKFPSTRHIVIDDVRYVDEAKRLKELDFILIKIVRDEESRLEEIWNSTGGSQRLFDSIIKHPSELEIEKIPVDQVYVNEETAQQFSVDMSKLAGIMRH